MKRSDLSGLYRLDPAARIGALQEAGWLTADEARRLISGRYLLGVEAANRITENVVGTFALPLSVATNFRLNGADVLVPMVVEEPSVVAALSHAAKLARNNGGFHAECARAWLVGQIHVTGLADIQAAAAAISAAETQLLDAANRVHPRLVERGGGARNVSVRQLALRDGSDSLVVEVAVDTGDAMGANLVNTICEALSPQVESLAGGSALLRILSNLCDQSIASARARFSAAELDSADLSGTRLRDAIVMANEIAIADPYRAATHNKGIMNGIDAVAVATGNDWRAIEAGAHAYAARDGSYRSLTEWRVDDDGTLLGEIALPIKAGTVGGTLAANPAAGLGLRLTGMRNARQLASLYAAVGLAQNFSALKALAGNGIQRGHMRLHARSVVAAAGVADSEADAVTKALVADGNIKVWRAQELAREQKAVESGEVLGTGCAAGKVILLGEHAVVYGRHALALPLEQAVRVEIRRAPGPARVRVPAWSVDQTLDSGTADGLLALLHCAARETGVELEHFDIVIDSALPPAKGLGSSAACAVAVARALLDTAGRTLSDDAINAVAFACEKLAHGTPSGIDNTVATFAAPLLFRRAEALSVERLSLPSPPPLVIASGAGSGNTADIVAAVRRRVEAEAERYERVFDLMDSLAIQGAHALVGGNLNSLADAMNVGHGLLAAIQVSTTELDDMVDIARRAGALGAKLTGAGGGGCIVALCPGTEAAVSEALTIAGYQVLDAAMRANGHA